MQTKWDRVTVLGRSEETLRAWINSVLTQIDVLNNLSHNENWVYNGAENWGIQINCILHAKQTTHVWWSGSGGKWRTGTIFHLDRFACTDRVQIEPQSQPADLTWKKMERDSVVLYTSYVWLAADSKVTVDHTGAAIRFNFRPSPLTTDNSVSICAALVYHSFLRFLIIICNPLSRVFFSFYLSSQLNEFRSLKSLIEGSGLVHKTSYIILYSMTILSFRNVRSNLCKLMKQIIWMFFVSYPRECNVFTVQIHIINIVFKHW